MTSTKLSCMGFGPRGATTARISVKEAMDYNARTFKRNPLGEIAGSLGDMGTLLPLMTAMSAAGIINLTSTLVFSGFWNIISGCVFGVPIVVQPMKAVAAISISHQLTLQETMAAGLSVAVVLVILSLTGLLHTIGSRIPVPLVKGIQLGAGLSLMIGAGNQLASVHWAVPWQDNYVLLLLSGILLCFTSHTGARFPYALFVFVLGIVFAASKISRGQLPSVGFTLPPFIMIRWEDMKNGLSVGIAQLPLTVLNSVIAVSYLSADLLPERPSPPITAMGLSVAGMNLVGCFFGAMPICHGAGGLAGQHRFGARSGASVIFLGTIKVILGLAFGSSLSGLLDRFPHVFLAVLLFAAGSELARVAEDLNSTARDLWTTAGEEAGDSTSNTGSSSSSSALKQPPMDETERKERFMVMIFTAGGVIAIKNVAIGLLAGSLCWAGYRFQDWLEQKPFGRFRTSVRRRFRRSEGETQTLL